MTRRRITILTLATLAAAGAMVTSAHAQAMAVSSSGGDVPSTRPAELTPLERANADAVARLEAQIASERLDDGTSVGQLLDRVDGRAVLAGGLSDAEQVGGPRYVTEDLVQVQRQISGPRVATLVKQAVDAKPDRCPVPRGRLDSMLAKFDGRAFTSTGNSDRALANVSATSDHTDATAPAIAIPDREPAWTMDPIVTSAHAPAAGSKLRTARAAEHQARLALRTQVERLKLDDQHTLGDLAGSNAGARDLIDRAIGDARVSGVDYQADGSVDVRVALDGQRLWQTIQRLWQTIQMTR